MKVLVATQLTNNPEKGDFCYASEDELVFRHEHCNSPTHPKCNCGKALAGTRTQYLTNTVKVADKAYFADETDKIHPSVRELREIAEQYETGSVLEVQPDGIILRQGSYVWPDLILED